MRIRPTVAAVDLDALRHNLGVAWGLVGGGITFSPGVRARMATQRFDKEHGEKV